MFASKYKNVTLVCKMCKEEKGFGHFPHVRISYGEIYVIHACMKCLGNESNISASEKQKNVRRQMRVECIEHYGGMCSCCGEKNMEFLSFDHVNGGGNKYRTENNSKRGQLYRELIKFRFPSEFRILCHNCNMSIGIYGHCPHQRDK